MKEIFVVVSKNKMKYFFNFNSIDEKNNLKRYIRSKIHLTQLILFWLSYLKHVSNKNVILVRFLKNRKNPLETYLETLNFKFKLGVKNRISSFLFSFMLSEYFSVSI